MWYLYTGAISSSSCCLIQLKAAVSEGKQEKKRERREEGKLSRSSQNWNYFLPCLRQPWLYFQRWAGKWGEWTWKYLDKDGKIILKMRLRRELDRLEEKTEIFWEILLRSIESLTKKKKSKEYHWKKRKNSLLQQKHQEKNHKGLHLKEKAGIFLKATEESQLWQLSQFYQQLQDIFCIFLRLNSRVNTFSTFQRKGKWGGERGGEEKNKFPESWL